MHSIVSINNSGTGAKMPRFVCSIRFLTLPYLLHGAFNRKTAAATPIGS